MNGAVAQLRGGRVLDVTVGHATGQRCAALRVVRPGRSHRQRTADADQQRLVGRRKIQLHAVATEVLDHGRADVGLGVLPGTVHRRTAGQGNAELGLRGLRALPRRRAPATEQALGFVEVLGQPGAAVAVGLVRHAFQCGHLAERAGLERIHEARVFRILFGRQLILRLLQLFRRALGDGAGRGHRAGQTTAAGVDCQLPRGDRAYRCHAAAGREGCRHRTDEGAGVGIQLLVGNAGPNRHAVAHRNGTGHGPHEQVFIGTHANRGCTDVGTVADPGQRGAVQVECGGCSADTDAAALA